MTATSTLTHFGVEGNRRINYGEISCTSTDVIIRSMSTGLRTVETLKAWSRISGGIAIVSYPLTLPALDVSTGLSTTSGNFTIDFTTPESGVVYWEARGKV